MLAYRARYYVGVLTYLFNVAVYYFIWRAVFQHAATGRRADACRDDHLRRRGLGDPLLLLQRDRPGARDPGAGGRLAMSLIRPVDFQTVMIADAAGQSAFRAVLFTVPISFVLALLFPLRPPASPAAGLLFLSRPSCRSFSSRRSTSSWAWSRSVRSRSSGSSAPSTWSSSCSRAFSSRPRSFPEPLRTVLFSSPFPHINFTPATLYLGKARASRRRGSSRSRPAGRSRCWRSVNGPGGARGCGSRSRADESFVSIGFARPRRASSGSTSRSTRRPGWSTGSTSSRASSPRFWEPRPRSASC